MMGRIRMMPAWLYQRYRSFFDRLAPLLAMSLLFVLVNQATGVFSRDWLWFIAGGIVVAGLIAPVVGYVLFVFALAYPLYSISIYLAALALSVLVLLAFFVNHHFAALVLLLAIPLLVPFGIIWVVPLIAGLWWAEWGGVLVGMGGAFWLKVFAGMCGATPDLIQLSGQTLITSQVIERFHTANSLQTLRWMTEPLAPDSKTLLLHIIEILGWGLAGYGVGLMRRRMEGMSRRNLGLVGAIIVGFLGLSIGSLILPLALGLRQTSDLPISLLLNFLIECGKSVVIVMGLYGVSYYLIRPVVRSAPSWIKSRRSSVQPVSELAPQPWVRPQPRAEEDEPTDIIMIDLD
ncbi:MAG: hypothetical protein GY832_18175 [Chloroflexi bacterium]|nr:hypothetical protein [Chloroflexota bacterium]